MKRVMKEITSCNISKEKFVSLNILTHCNFTIKNTLQISTVLCRPSQTNSERRFDVGSP